MYTAKREWRTPIITKIHLADYWRIRLLYSMLSINDGILVGVILSWRDVNYGQRTSTHVRNIVRDALIRGTIRSTVVAAFTLSRSTMYHCVVHNQQCLCLTQEPLYLSRALMQRFCVLYVTLCHSGQTNSRVNAVYSSRTAHRLQILKSES